MLISDIFANIAIFIAVLFLLYYLYNTLTLLRKSEEKARERIKEAENKVEKEPEKSKPVWDLARVTLDEYFNKNLFQVSAIFWCVFR